MGEAAAPTTAIHTLVDRCRAADYPPLVARVRSGWSIMGERQLFAGYCLLIPDPVVPHLNALTSVSRAQFLSDMALVGDAIMAATSAVRINYAMFGNLEPALHAHLFPRGADEPQATRTAQPWAFDWSLAPEYSVAAHGDLKRRIAAHIEEAHIALHPGARGRLECGPL
jgi:diadenosine tetraphosphate (Ap4A) HIT family hydrolase